jgi:hypothetical protein
LTRLQHWYSYKDIFYDDIEIILKRDEVSHILKRHYCLDMLKSVADNVHNHVKKHFDKIIKMFQDVTLLDML